MAKEGTSTRSDIPADMRALAEKSVEQAKQAFDIFISAAQHAVSTAENQAVTAQAGAKEVGELAMGFAERNVRVFIRICAEVAAGQRADGCDGAALGICEFPKSLRSPSRPGN